MSHAAGGCDVKPQHQRDLGKQHRHELSAPASPQGPTQKGSCTGTSSLVQESLPLKHKRWRPTVAYCHELERRILELQLALERIRERRAA